MAQHTVNGDDMQGPTPPVNKNVSVNFVNQPSATIVAQEIRQKIFEKTGLTASAGVSMLSSPALEKKAGKMSAAMHCGWCWKLKQTINGLQDSKVEIQHQNFRVLCQIQNMQLCEDTIKSRS